jgi:rubrerythrin
MEKLNTALFIINAKKIHEDKYDYSLVEYKNSRTKVSIICPDHGIFLQKPVSHINSKCGCNICSGSFKKTQDIFINEARKIHGNRYDYSLVEYKNNKTKVTIICPDHGVFNQTPKNHLVNKCNCPGCVGHIKKTKDVLINEVKKIHGDKYDYSLVEYKNNKTKVSIICPKHGVFNQTISHHMRGYGCNECLMDENLNKKIDTAKQIHNNKYDYSLVKSVGVYEKIKIICPEHGVFEQTLNNHIMSRKTGCPICKSSKGELKIKKWLDGKNITYIQQHRFPNCKYILPLPFDFYLPDYNICIEYDGEQHYKPIWGENILEKTINSDNIKNDYCKNNKIKLIRMKYNQRLEDVIKL